MQNTMLTFDITILLSDSDEERRERHRQNYMHISVHTSQAWADTFISELNDTHVEAELRTKHIPPQVTNSIISRKAYSRVSLA